MSDANDFVDSELTEAPLAVLVAGQAFSALDALLLLCKQLSPLSRLYRLELSIVERERHRWDIGGVADCFERSNSSLDL